MKSLILIGQSVRALATACAHCVLRHAPSGPVCELIAVDAYGDADTLAAVNGDWMRLEIEQEQLAPTLAEQLFNRSLRTENPLLLLAGGMENLPKVVEQLSDACQLLGPTSTQLSVLRDRGFWQSAAEQCGIRFPKTKQQLNATDLPQNWLWKPASSGGGIYICQASEHFIAPSAIGDVKGQLGYFQRIISGDSIGVTCILHSAKADPTCAIVGATLGLSASEWMGPSQFIYRGSVGPIGLSQQHLDQITELGNCFGRSTGLVGMIQFDFLRDEADQLWLLECNPRWTAGMEILFRAGMNPIEQHLATFGVPVRNQPVHEYSLQPWVGKAIVYAEQAGVISEAHVDELLRLAAQGSVADVPVPGTVYEAGQPLFTLIEQLPRDGKSELELRAAVVEQLRANQRKVASLLL